MKNYEVYFRAERGVVLTVAAASAKDAERVAAQQWRESDDVQDPSMWDLGDFDANEVSA